MLGNDVCKYLAHKIRLAQVSAYYHRPAAKAAVQWALSMYQYLKYNQGKISERDLALMLRGSEKHLQQLLPFEANKSYESSNRNLNRILTRCGDLLQPKKQQVS